MNNHINTIQTGAGYWMQRLRAEINAFHNEEQGISTMEALLLLFIAGVAIFALSKGGKAIMAEVSKKTSDVLTFSYNW